MQHLLQQATSALSGRQQLLDDTLCLAPNIRTWLSKSGGVVQIRLSWLAANQFALQQASRSFRHG